MTEDATGPFRVGVKLEFPGNAQHDTGIARLEMTNQSDRTVFVAAYARTKVQRPLLNQITFDFTEPADAVLASGAGYFSPPVTAIAPGETVTRDELIPATMRRVAGKDKWVYEIHRVGYVIPYSTKPLVAANPLSPSTEELNQWKQGLIKGTCRVEALDVPGIG